MRAVRTRALLWGAALAFLGWAVVEARHVDWRGLTSPRPIDAAVIPQQVEESFAAIRAATTEGRTEEALLALRRRAERGPHRGYAWYLLGELAIGQGAYAAAVRHYRRAVELDPTVVDRNGAFHAGAAIDTRLTELLEGAWADNRPPEMRDLYFLRRRLGGGCE
jgi:cytochrome c-type biogenesis protein CcmH/NrfG